MLFTWGYANRRPADLFRVLNSMNVMIVVDVRANPVSQNGESEFDRERLEEFSREHKVKYIWLPALGNMTKSYTAVVLAKPEVGFRKLEEILRQYGNVLLLCSEKKPYWCHRSYIARIMQERVRVPVVHL